MKTLANQTKEKIARHTARKNRTNKTVKAVSTKPRLIVNKSNKFNYAQIIDLDGKVIAASSDLKITKGTKSEKAKQVGEDLAKKATKKWVKEVVFDRNGYLYHGRIKSLAEGARQGWLVF